MNRATAVQNVATLLKNMSEPGGLLEDTLLIVMGDHGQTLNGDHGGGTPEEVMLPVRFLKQIVWNNTSYLMPIYRIIVVLTSRN